MAGERVCKRDGGCKHTVCIPHPLLPRGPRLCAPPWRPPSSTRKLSGGALPISRAEFAPPRLCAQMGNAEQRAKVRPPPLAPLTRTAQRAQRPPPAPLLPLPARANRVGRRRHPHSGVDRERRAYGGEWEGPRGWVRRRGHPSLLLRAGVPRKRSARAAPPFTLFPYPMRLIGAAHNPRAAREAGAPKGSGAPPPLRVSTTPRAVPRARPLHAPPSGARRALSRMRDGVCMVASEGGACRGRAHTLFPAGVESAPRTSASCAGCATPHLAQLRAQEPRACACPHPLCRTPTSLPAVGVEAARRATLGRVEEAARDSGGGGRGCTSPRATREVASTRPRARMHEPVRNPGSGQSPTPAAEGEAEWDSTQPRQIGEGRRSEAAQPRWAGRVRETTRDPEGEAPPPLGARATPHLCLRPRPPSPPHPASDLEKRTVHSLCKLYYIILYYQYIYFSDYTTICYGVNVQVCASHDAARDVREVASKASSQGLTKTLQSTFVITWMSRVGPGRRAMGVHPGV